MTELRGTWTGKRTLCSAGRKYSIKSTIKVRWGSWLSRHRAQSHLSRARVSYAYRHPRLFSRAKRTIPSTQMASLFTTLLQSAVLHGIGFPKLKVRSYPRHLLTAYPPCSPVLPSTDPSPPWPLHFQRSTTTTAPIFSKQQLFKAQESTEMTKSL